jgi:hypothetical protein
MEAGAGGEKKLKGGCGSSTQHDSGLAPMTQAEVTRRRVTHYNV